MPPTCIAACPLPRYKWSGIPEDIASELLAKAPFHDLKGWQQRNILSSTSSHSYRIKDKAELEREMDWQ